MLSASLLVFTLVLANFFDAMGTMTALGKQAGLVDEDGNLPDMKKALIVEGAGAIVGGGVSASSNTVYVDSAAGIADGARTGLANVVTGVLFLLAMFLTPLYEIVPIEAASPVLVIVGALMMAQIKDIDFSQFHIALPAFLTIIIMPVYLLHRQWHRRRLYYLRAGCRGHGPRENRALVAVADRSSVPGVLCY